MLKGIPNILSPDLLKIMMEMGHGDEIVLADGNFPKFGHPKNVVRMDGHGIPVILDAIMQFMPLDAYVENPVMLMAVLPSDPYIPTIWDEFRQIICKYEPLGARDVSLDKPEFYKRASNAYALVTTSESALYANIILKKGVL